MKVTLTIVMLAALAGCASNGSNPSSGVSDLQDARLSASTLTARKLMYKKVEGTFTKGQPAKYKAYYSGEVLRVVQEESVLGDYGESEKEYFLDAEGRLFYYVASDERPKQSAKEPKQSAQEKVKTRIAYNASGQVVESERLINGQPGKLSAAEIKAVKARFDALRKAADASKKPKAG